MRGACVLVALVAAPAVGADEPRQLKVHAHPGLPGVERVTVYQTRDGKRETAGELTKLDAALPLPSGGPFEVWVTPKGGVAVRAADGLTVKAGATHELKLGEALGAVEVLGDDLPRAKKVVLTAVRDPGPGEKGHVAVQSASDYRAALLAPPGTYAVWVVPANGARPQRVEDGVRVQAGRTTRIGD